jgi:hypothetical protein
VNRSDFERDFGEERTGSGYALVALLLAMLLVVLLVTSSRDNARPQRTATPQECKAINDGGSRLDCYDQIFQRGALEPAKGATAPLEQR